MELATYVDSLWIVVAGILVMFMQPGFMLVETGFTRSKNSVNIVMKNFMDFSVGAITYWAFGFALAYGGTTLGGFLAYGSFFLEGDSITYFFQVVFAATAATIVSGAVAERTKFSAYLLFQPFICGVIYPIVTHWVWSGQGWLGDLGFIDFAGSGVVHMGGGFAALAGLVGITAGCANVNNLGAVLIGLVSGALVVYSINFLEKKGFDDAVGAVSVHGICGIWGVLAVAIFDTSDGLFYGGGGTLFGPQLIGILAIGAWAYATSYLVFKVIDSTVGLRVTAEEEIAGLDASEHGTSAYGDFITKK